MLKTDKNPSFCILFTFSLLLFLLSPSLHAGKDQFNLPPRPPSVLLPPLTPQEKMGVQRLKTPTRHRRLSPLPTSAPVPAPSLSITEKNRQKILKEFSDHLSLLPKTQKPFLDYIIENANLPSEDGSCVPKVQPVDLEAVTKIILAISHNKKFMEKASEEQIETITKKIWNLYVRSNPLDKAKKALSEQELGRIIAFSEIWGDEFIEMAKKEKKTMFYDIDEMIKLLKERGASLTSFPRSLVVTPEGNLYFLLKTKDELEKIGSGSYKEVKYVLDYKNLRLVAGATLNAITETTPQDVDDFVQAYFSQQATSKKRDALKKWLVDQLRNESRKNFQKELEDLFHIQDKQAIKDLILKNINQRVPFRSKTTNTIIQREEDFLQLASGQQGIIKTLAMTHHQGREHLKPIHEALINVKLRAKDHFDRNRQEVDKLLIIQPLCQGDLFQEDIKDQIFKVFSQNPKEGIKIFKGMAQGLLNFHQLEKDGQSLGAVHRDIKPENFLWCFNEESGQFEAVLSDFGLSVKRADDSSENQAWKKELVGTPDYLPPETLKNKRINREMLLDEAGDIWALGLVFYELYHGVPPEWSLAARPPMSLPNVIKHLDQQLANPNEFSTDYPEPNPKNSLDHLLWRTLKIKPEERISLPNLIKELEKLEN